MSQTTPPSPVTPVTRPTARARATSASAGVLNYGLVLAAASFLVEKIDQFMLPYTHVHLAGGTSALLVGVLTVVGVIALQYIGESVVGVPPVIMQYVWQVEQLIHEFHVASPPTVTTVIDPPPPPFPPITPTAPASAAPSAASPVPAATAGGTSTGGARGADAVTTVTTTVTETAPPLTPAGT